MVGIGNIVSVGGSGGGTSSSSGVSILNGQTGPEVTLVGTSGIVISPVAPNVINIGYDGSIQSGVFGVNGIDVEQVAGEYVVDGASLSGLITPSGGIGSINGQIGPTIDIQGVNGVTVTVPGTNTLLIDGAGASGVGGGGTASGVCYTETFTSQTSVTANHGLGTANVVVNVFDASDDQMLPDRLNIVDTNNVLVQFNRPQTGKIVIVGCGGDDTNFELCKRYALLVS
jgi:hypothetical protein